jgi:hypothetical protein
MSPWAVNDQEVSPFNRYEGIDLFRVVAAYGIILIHFHIMLGDNPSNPSNYWLIQSRDYSFPFFIMSSFFVLTVSFLRNPSRKFWEFLEKRLIRIWLPFLIWTILYWWMARVFRWVMFGEKMSFPPLTLFLSGYMHLWYLQFIFIGSLLIEPILRCLGHKKEYRWKLSLFCLIVGFLYPLLYEPLFQHTFNFERLSQVDGMLQLSAVAALRCLSYIPLGIGVALLADKIVLLYCRPMFRTLSIVVIAISMAFHFGTSTKLSREVYSLAVFVALLGPLPRIPFNGIQRIARYTYGIYILHFLISGVVTTAIRQAGIGFTMGVLLAGSCLVFSLSLLGTVMLRKVFPRDWFVPLVPVNFGKSTFNGV